MAAVVMAEATMEDTMTIATTGTTAMVEKMKDRIYVRTLDAATGCVITKINTSLQLPLGSIWWILLSLGMKAAILQAPLIEQEPSVSYRAAVDTTVEVIPVLIILKDMMDRAVPVEVIRDALKSTRFFLTFHCILFALFALYALITKSKRVV